MDLSGLSNRFCVFRLGISSAGIDYFLVFFFGFRLLCLDSDLAGLCKHLMQQGLDVLMFAALCFYIH